MFGKTSKNTVSTNIIVYPVHIIWITIVSQFTIIKVILSSYFIYCWFVFFYAFEKFWELFNFDPSKYQLDSF